MKMTVHPKEKFVGLFVLTAFILCIVVVYLNVRSILEERFMLRLVLPQTYGLKVTDKVKLKGLSIGDVYSIDIMRDLRTNEDNIEVLLRISEKKYLDFLKRDSVVTIVPALGPLPASIEIQPGTEEELLPSNSDIRLREFPTTSIEGMIGDVSESIRNFKDVTSNFRTEGLTSLLGPEIHTDIKEIQHSIEAIVSEIREMTGDAKSIIGDLRKGETTISKLVFGEKPLLESVLGAQAQNRIDELNSNEQGMLAFLLGPKIWSEIESASKSWEPLSSAVQDFIAEGKTTLQRTQDVLTEVNPVLSMLSENRSNFEDFIATTNRILSDVQQITQTIANEKEQIPMSIRQLREVIANIDRVAKAVNNHWLLAPYSKPAPADSSIPVRTFRPNNYNE